MKKWILAMLLAAPILSWGGQQEAVEAYRTADYASAMTQFKALAAEGDAVAMYYLGIFYDRGYGVPADAAAAAKWFEQGAARGDSLSAYHLGKMAETGKGVPKDPVAAHMWLTLSATKAPNERDAAYTRRDIRKLEKSMTPEQIAKAKELIANWKPEK
jgi:TPR repeat protein